MTNFYANRKKYNEWMLNKAKQCGVSESELQPFRQQLWRETILFGFINASITPVPDSEKPAKVRSEMTEIMKGEIGKFADFGRFPGCLKHRLEYWILMKLIISERYELAYYLNRHCFHRTV